MPKRSRQLTTIKSQDHSQKFSSLLLAYTPWETANSSQQSSLTEIVHRGLWVILTRVAMNHSCVVRGCDHFQIRFFCGCINQIVSSNSRLPPWKFKRLQTTLRPSKPTSARQCVVVSEQATKHRWMLDVNIKAELNILPSDSRVNRCLVYIGEA